MSSPSQTLADSGYLVIKDAVSQSNLSELTKSARQALLMVNEHERVAAKSLGSLIRLESFPEIQQQIISHIPIHVVEDLFGKDYLRHCGIIFSKPRNLSSTFWHQDFIGWGEQAAYSQQTSQIQLLIYLQETCRKTGSLRVIPKSHRHRHALHQRWQQGLEQKDGNYRALVSELRAGPQIDELNWAFADHEDAVDVEVSAGDVVILDSRLLHGANVNEQLEERLLVTFSFFVNPSNFSDSFQAAIRHEVQTQKFQDAPHRVYLPNLSRLSAVGAVS